MGDNTIYYIIAALAAIIVIYFLRKRNNEETKAETVPAKTEPSPSPKVPEAAVNTAGSDTENEIAAAIAAALHCYEEDKNKASGNTFIPSSVALEAPRYRRLNSNWTRTARYESHKKL